MFFLDKNNCSVAWYFNISDFADDDTYHYFRVLRWYDQLSSHQINSSNGTQSQMSQVKGSMNLNSISPQYSCKINKIKRHHEFHIWPISLFNVCHMYKFLLFVIYLLCDCKIWIFHKMEISRQKMVEHFDM